MGDVTGPDAPDPLARADGDGCPTCGRSLADHDRHLRFPLPQPVLDIPEFLRPDLSWGNDAFLNAEGVGGFVRVLVPVRLEGGHRIVFATWLGVHAPDLKRAYDAWDSPDYPTFEVAGAVANALPPFEDRTLERPAVARVLDPDHPPYVVSSTDPGLTAVLTTEWPHELVLAALGPARP